MSRLTPSQVEKAKRAIQVLSDLDLYEENSVKNPSPPTNSSNQATDEGISLLIKSLMYFINLRLRRQDWIPSTLTQISFIIGSIAVFI